MIEVLPTIALQGRDVLANNLLCSSGTIDLMVFLLAALLALLLGAPMVLSAESPHSEAAWRYLRPVSWLLALIWSLLLFHLAMTYSIYGFHHPTGNEATSNAPILDTADLIIITLLSLLFLALTYMLRRVFGVQVREFQAEESPHRAVSSPFPDIEFRHKGVEQ